MAEGDMEWAVHEALAAVGLSVALVDGQEPFRVRWANAAFARELGAVGAAIEGQPLLALMGCADAGASAVLERVHAEGSTSLVLARGEGRHRRERELILLPVPGPSRERAVLVLVRDVTEREQARGRLEAENFRLAQLATITRQLLSLEPPRVLDAAVGAACSISNGPTAIYLVGPGGEVRRTATAGMSIDLADLMPLVLRPGQLPLLARALESGQRQSVPYAPTLPADERTLLRDAAARWLVVTPIRGRQGIIGALVTLWRQRMPGEALPFIDLIAGQIGIAVEHAREYRAANDERARLELILAQIPDAVLIADAAGQLERTNAAGPRLLGLEPGDPLPALDALQATITWRRPGGRLSCDGEPPPARAP